MNTTESALQKVDISDSSLNSEPNIHNNNNLIYNVYSVEEISNPGRGHLGGERWTVLLSD